jgi:hypothetical protein
VYSVGDIVFARHAVRSSSAKRRWTSCNTHSLVRGLSAPP